MELIVGQVLIEFLEAAIHNILYYRKIYPSNIFVQKKKYGIQVFKSIHPHLNEYIGQTLKAIQFHITARALKRVLICIHSQNAILEKYVFEVTSLEGCFENDPMLVKLGEYFRTLSLKLSTIKEYTKELPDDAEFNVKIHATTSSLLAFNDHTEFTDFPWIQIDANEDNPKQQILPLLAFDSTSLALQAYIVH